MPTKEQWDNVFDDLHNIVSEDEAQDVTTKQKLEYLFSKINWGASALDALSIQYMNELPGDIDALQEIARIAVDKNNRNNNS